MDGYKRLRNITFAEASEAATSSRDLFAVIFNATEQRNALKHASLRFDQLSSSLVAVICSSLWSQWSIQQLSLATETIEDKRDERVQC